MEAKNSLLGKLPFFLEHLYFKYVLFFQDIRRKNLIRQTSHLADTLGNSLFPRLQKLSQSRVTIKIDHERGVFLPIATDKKIIQELGQSKDLAFFLAGIGIHSLELDTLLEENQITNAMTLLFHSAGHLPEDLKTQTFQKIYNARALAAAISSDSGLNKFCANIRLDQGKGIFSIEYSYCALFYTFTVNTVLDRYTKTKNHQAIFSLAPKLGIAIGLLFLLHHLFWSPYSTAGITAALFGSLTLGSGIAYLTSTLASVLYDQEHRDKLLQEKMKEITALSHFPVRNPNPIMKLGGDGSILFVNSAAKNQARAMGLSQDSLTELLPVNYMDLINECLEEQKEFIDLEVSSHGRTLRFNISPFPDEKAVLASGTDITRLKELEMELRQLNKNLEEKVLDRTREIAATQDITILSLSSLAETRDPETGAHIQRTRMYVKILAEYLRDKPRFRDYLAEPKVIDLLYRSAPLHDIGKVGIPDSILLKPGPLTSEEKEIMKKHPVIGGDSLGWAVHKLGEDSFLELAREIAYNHHEKWDGSGYPQGLAADNIPISCRLMALGDVYDALVNKRVYKEAYTHERAKAILLEKRGAHFDPDVVDAFIAIEEKFVTIANTYRDNE